MLPGLQSRRSWSHDPPEHAHRIYKGFEWIDKLEKADDGADFRVFGFQSVSEECNYDLEIFTFKNVVELKDMMTFEINILSYMLVFCGII